MWVDLILRMILIELIAFEPEIASYFGNEFLLKFTKVQQVQKPVMPSGTSLMRPHRLHFHLDMSINETKGLIYERQLRQRTILLVVITGSVAKSFCRIFLVKIF